MNISSFSSEEEKLSQMIKDYIESSSSSSSPSSTFNHSNPLLHVHDDNPIFFSLQEIMEETPEAEAEVYGKILLYMKHDIIKSSSIDKIKKWIVFRLEMDGYDAHLCNTSWFTPFGPPSVFQFRGEYEYVDVMMRDQINGCDETMRLIVDIDFKTQFELARPTPNYQELINALPHIFVGTQDKLEKLISFVCTAAKHSLTERGLHIPPWRKQSYMHSKWLSHNCKKLSFSELSILNNYTPKNGIMGCFQDFLQVQKCGGFKF